MEAAAVARGAQSHGLQFKAVKAISDEHDFEMPPMERFIRHDGQFRTAAFAVFIAIRPWLWTKAARLARNSAKASDALCAWLSQQDRDLEKLENSGSESHLIKATQPQATVQQWR